MHRPSPTSVTSSPVRVPSPLPAPLTPFQPQVPRPRRPTASSPTTTASPSRSAPSSAFPMPSFSTTTVRRSPPSPPRSPLPSHQRHVPHGPPPRDRARVDIHRPQALPLGLRAPVRPSPPSTAASHLHTARTSAPLWTSRTSSPMSPSSSQSPTCSSTRYLPSWSCAPPSPSSSSASPLPPSLNPAAKTSACMPPTCPSRQTSKCPPSSAPLRVASSWLAPRTAVSTSYTTSNQSPGSERGSTSSTTPSARSRASYPASLPQNQTVRPPLIPPPSHLHLPCRPHRLRRLRPQTQLLVHPFRQKRHLPLPSPLRKSSSTRTDPRQPVQVCSRESPRIPCNKSDQLPDHRIACPRPR